MHMQTQTQELNELNKLSAVQVQLIMLRCLNTSDLTFQYMLYSPVTLFDIINRARDMLRMEPDSLTAEETAEYMEYLVALGGETNDRSGS
jgi:hypothetical protein